MCIRDRSMKSDTERILSDCKLRPTIHVRRATWRLSRKSFEFVFMLLVFLVCHLTAVCLLSGCLCCIRRFCLKLCSNYSCFLSFTSHSIRGFFCTWEESKTFVVGWAFLQLPALCSALFYGVKSVHYFSVCLFHSFLVQVFHFQSNTALSFQNIFHLNYF